MKSRLTIANRIAAHLTRQLLSASLVCTQLFLAACGTSGTTKATGNVTVTIASGGQPVPAASVQLVSTATGADLGKGAFGDLDKTGTIKFPAVEVGSYTVTVLPPAPLNPEPGKPLPPPQNVVNIPAKFHSQTTSTFKADVKKGDNKFAFDLKQ